MEGVANIVGAILILFVLLSIMMPPEYSIAIRQFIGVTQ